jgi:hypothetical protein
MRYLEDVKEMLCRELEDMSRRGEISGEKELDAIDKLTHSIKSIETIMAMQDAGYSNDGRGGSYDGGMNNGGGSYARGRYQRRDSRGRYTNSYDDGYSERMYDPYYGGDYRRGTGYSRHDAKENMIEQMRETMQNTSSEETKEALRKAIQMMEKEQ